MPNNWRPPPPWPDLIPAVIHWPRMVTVTSPQWPRYLTAVEADPPTGPCPYCRQIGRPYRHPNPLRSNVVVYRCYNHNRVGFVRDDPKAAPGGGRYR